VLLDGLNEDWRLKLSLAHYSIQLSSIFVMEYSFAQIIHNHFIANNSNIPLKAKDLYEQGLKFADIFSLEHMINCDLTPDLMNSRFEFFVQRNKINYNKQSGEITLLKGTGDVGGLLHYFQSMA
jgi:hypothetical protein